MFQKIYNKITEYDTIIIHRHTRPDGDALGSQIGLKTAILSTFPNKCVKITGDMIERYAWMGKMDEIEDDLYPQALVIVCDCGAEKLISDERYRQGNYVIKIDHHLPQGSYGDMAFVDTSYESCSRMVADLILNTPLQLTPQAASILFTGIVTDSGRFRYAQTTSHTYQTVSKLMACGVDTEYIYNQLYTEKLSNIKLRAKLISKFKVTKSGVAYLVNTKEEVKKYGLPLFDISRGMVNIMAGIEGILVWANFTEDETGEVYCEFRSNGININPVAAYFGGGGHMQASGCTLPNLSYVKEAVKLLEKRIKENQDASTNSTKN